MHSHDVHLSIFLGSRTIYVVERLIADHRQLHSEFSVKVDQIEECLEVGRDLLEAPKQPGSPQFSSLYLAMTGPRGEVREACVLLATERIITGELWRERWDRLQMLLDVRYFVRDSDASSAWLNSREVVLVLARRNFGETLAETLAYLGAHYAFEKACAGAQERFEALKRLTRVSDPSNYPSCGCGLNVTKHSNCLNARAIRL